jgi:hypothetical protein
MTAVVPTSWHACGTPLLVSICSLAICTRVRGFFGALIGSLAGCRGSSGRSGRPQVRPRCRSWRSAPGFVGSRITKAPYDLAGHFERHGNYFTDGQVLESTRLMGTGQGARDRRVVYQWKFKREQHDNKAVNAMVTKAEKVADEDQADAPRPVRQGHRHEQGRGLGPRGTRPPARRPEGPVTCKTPPA